MDPNEKDSIYDNVDRRDEYDDPKADTIIWYDDDGEQHAEVKEEN